MDNRFGREGGIMNNQDTADMGRFSVDIEIANNEDIRKSYLGY